jgi:hypothetical protein
LHLPRLVSRARRSCQTGAVQPSRTPHPRSFYFTRSNLFLDAGFTFRRCAGATSADLEYHPKDFARIVKVFAEEQADAVFGLRFADSAQV